VARAEHKSTHRIRLAAAAAAALLALTTAAAQIAGDEAAPSPQTPTSSEDRALGVPRNAPGAPDAEARRTASGGSGAWIGQTLLSLGGVLGLAVVGAGALRLLARSNGSLRASLGAGGRAPAGIMEILGRYPVGRGATLVLLKLDRRILLLSQSAGGRFGAGAGFQTLAEITDPDEVASILIKARDAEGDSMSERFRTLLGRFDRSMAEAEETAGRTVTASTSGDRAELWDDRNAIPVVDLTRQPGPADTSAVGSLRRRLASVRWPGLEGGKA